MEKISPRLLDDKYIRVGLTQTKLYPSDFVGSKYRKGDDSFIVENNFFNQMLLGIEKHEDVDTTLKFPEGLFDYQKLDVARMVTSSRILNLNRMGYGKTVETCAAMREIGCANGVIVCPRSIKYQWRNLLLKWYPEITEDRIVVVDSGKEDIRPDTFVIVNYERLLNERILMALKRWSWDVLVCDEVHRVKNPKSKRTICTKSIPAQRIWGLTGTPILNKPDDLWSILNLLGVEYSGKSYWNFVNYFCNIEITVFGKQVTGLTKNEFRVKLLNMCLQSIAIINPEMNVTKGRVYSIVKLKMGDRQRKLYRDAKNILLEELPENLTIPNGAVLCTRLMQITSNSGLFVEKEPGAKFEYIRDLLEDNPNEKFVIFSKFATTCMALQKYLNSKTVPYIGSMSSADRAESKRIFIEDPSCQAIVGTIAAMAEGVDGLQNVSHIAIFIDREWSPEIMKQAETRLDRFGQTHQVQIIQLECIGTFDRHVGRVNMTKANDIRKALTGEGREEDDE